MICSGFQRRGAERVQCLPPPFSYCTILINSAGHVTRYMPAKNLDSAHGGNDCYIHIFSADFYDFFAIFKAFFTTSFYGFSTWPK